MFTITASVPAPIATPRAAKLVAWLFDAFEALAVFRRARTEQRRLRKLADDRAAVHALASSIQNLDPGMAADLRAAACRDGRQGA